MSQLFFNALPAAMLRRATTVISGEKMRKIIFTIILAMMLLTGMTACGGNSTDLNSITAETAAVLMEQVPEPAMGSIGGEWTVIALAQSGVEVDSEYYDEYYDRLCRQVELLEGKLSATKYTEYARVSMAVNAIGREPENVAGYNLMESLKDTEKVVIQGLNGPVYALIASNECGYELGGDIEKQYLNYILSMEVSGGGFGYSEDAVAADVDMTAMVLQALAYYIEDADVKRVADRAVQFMADAQTEGGGYEFLESDAQTIIALVANGIDLYEDERFKGLTDHFLSFRLDDGMFAHEAGSDGDVMATEQALYALDALMEFQVEQN